MQALHVLPGTNSPICADKEFQWRAEKFKPECIKAKLHRAREIKIVHKNQDRIKLVTRIHWSCIEKRDKEGSEEKIIYDKK